jgi:ribonuclease HI
MTTAPAPQITLIADGSYRPQTGEAAWAGRIIVGQTRRTYSGAFILSGGCSNDTEVHALSHTFLRALQEGMLPPKAGVLFQTDSQHALLLFNHHFALHVPKHRPEHPPRSTKHQGDCIRQLRAAFATHQPEWVFAKHIPGHQPKRTRDARQHVQEAMDKQAEKARRQMQYAKDCAAMRR